MDAKTPPIPLKHQEKHRQPRKQERVADVSLPPLAPYVDHQQRQKQKQKQPAATWTRDAGGVQYQDHRRRRPYRILQIGATPLMHACQQADRARVIRLLNEQRETVGYRDRTLRSALHYCMDAGTGGAVAAAAPELVNAPDAEGHTPLHLAVIAGDTQLVAVLLASGADVDAKDREGHSVLHWATVCGEAECVRLVLAAGASPSTPDLRGGSPLHYAAQCCGAAATAELAVPKKVALRVLQTLLEFGADVNAADEDGRQPILWAASAGSVDAVLALARAGGSAAAGASDKDGLTALHCAASRGHVKCIEALVNLCGSQPDHVDDNGCSALHYAATLGQADATALILKLGADPNRQDRKGRTPALCAAAKGQLETLKILIQHGGSLHARTVRGTGVAHEAAASGRIELIKWLARKRPSTLRVTTQDGKAPLHVAALHGHLDVCKFLLDRGAQVNAVLRTSKGNPMTPLDAALYRGYRECAKLLQMHGGVTAQRLRAHQMAPNRAFASNLRAKHAESSPESESSSQTRENPSYYEERWLERRTRRRGSLRKLARRDSRSFSEEEVRLSKTSSKRDRQRRTRSECARYDEDDNGQRKLRKRRSKKRATKYKYDYTESSVDSESLDRSQDALEETGSARQRDKLAKRKTGRREQEEDGSNRSDEKEDSQRTDVSDDSLEVVVVERSVEKKSEKLVSGRRSKTPRESLRETKITRTRKRTSSRRRSGSRRLPENDESKEERVRFSESNRRTEEPEAAAARMSTEALRKGSVTGTRCTRDVTDSTSQETVECVVVTAMVHKDQAPDTPKFNTGLSEEVSKKGSKESSEEINQRESKKSKDSKKEAARNEDTVEEADSVRCETNVLERADEFINKTVDMKRDVEEMRRSIGQDDIRKCEDIRQTPREDVFQKPETCKIEADEEETHEGRSDKRRTNESEAQHSSDQSHSAQEDESRKSSSPVSVVEKSSRSKRDLSTEQNGTEKSGSTSFEDKPEEASSPRTIVEDIKASDFEESDNVENERSSSIDKMEKKSGERESECESESRRVRSKHKSSRKSDDEKETIESVRKSKDEKNTIEWARKSNDEKETVEWVRKSKDEEETVESVRKSIDEKETVESVRKSIDEKETVKSVRKSIDEKETVESARKSDDDSVSRDEKRARSRSEFSREQHGSREGIVISVRIPEADFVISERISKDDDKEQADSARGKSLDLSSDSRDSILEEEEVDGKIGETDKEGSTPRKLKIRRKCTDAAGRSSKDEMECTRSEEIEAGERFLYSDEHSTSSPSRARARAQRQAKASTSKGARSARSGSSRRFATNRDGADGVSTDQRAIVAVIDRPSWHGEDEHDDQDEDEDADEDEEIDKEIRRAIGEDAEQETDREEDNGLRGIVRILPSASEEDTLEIRHAKRKQGVRITSGNALESRRATRQSKQRRDSGGKDSGIEPSPRVSRIPRRKDAACCPNSEKQRALNMDTITSEVQTSVRRYFLERKIFFQLMELKRLQIRHGRANEHVLVKRQVEAFHKAGMSGPTLGVAKYNQPLTFRHFEAFLYEQLRKLQRRATTPDFCTEAKQCTQRTHRCHHATSAYTSVPMYTYLGGGANDRGEILPKIESRGRGQMTVELTHGEGKQVISLPAERLDHTKRYFVTFTVRGEAQGTERLESSRKAQRNAKSG